MATATEPRALQKSDKPTERPETVVTYIPLGEVEPINLTISRVKQLFCTPTKSGVYPNDAQVMKFILLCKAQGLNPAVNDAYLTGYDSKDGPSFSLITSIQAFLKRAEASPQFDGIEQGVILSKGGALIEREGDFMLPGEVLLGGWARVHRKDRRIPSYDRINLKTFDTGYSRWKLDPAGMIVKCAQASALRTAFPSTLAAMYCKEEMDRERESRDSAPHVDTRPKADRLAEQFLTATVETPAAEVPPATATLAAPVVQDSKPDNSQIYAELMTEICKADDNDKLNTATRLVTTAFSQDRISQDQYDDLLITIQEIRSRE